MFKLLHNCTHLTCQQSNAQNFIELQQYMNRELPDVQVGFRRGSGTRDKIANIHWIIKKAREFQKNIYFCFLDYAKAFDCMDANKLENFERDVSIRPPYLPTDKTGMQVKRQQLESDMKQWTGSKLGKEYNKAVYCHPAYLTYMQSISCAMPGQMNSKLDQDSQQKYQQPQKCR